MDDGNPENKMLVVADSDVLARRFDELTNIAPELSFLRNILSPRTQRAYLGDIVQFTEFHGIQTQAELRAVTRDHIIEWRNHILEFGGKPDSLGNPTRGKPNTLRRKISALSSLFTELIEQGVATHNPTLGVRRVRTKTVDGRRRGATNFFTPEQARKILDSPPVETKTGKPSLLGMRDRAILAIGFEAGLRRSEIASLTVRSIGERQGYPSLTYFQKGGNEHVEIIKTQTLHRIRDYMKEAGHLEDLDAPLFQPVRAGRNQKGLTLRKHLDSDLIDKILRKYCYKALRIQRGYSAHSMRTTFATTALKNGARLKDVQDAMGHADASTTRLYDHSDTDPEKAACQFVVY